MKLFFNTNNEVDISGLNPKSTVQDFFDAVDDFLSEHPLPCDKCKDNCCKGRFKINMDSIAAKRMSKGNIKRLIPKLFINMGENKLEIFMVAGHKKCRHLDGLGRCLVYQKRTASCRTYICIPQSTCYKILDSAIAAEMHHAMRAEFIDTVLSDPATPTAALEPAKALRQEIVSTSIAYGCNDYTEILLKDCVNAEFAHANVSVEDARFFHDLLNKAATE